MRIWIIEEGSINFIVEMIDKMIIIVNYQNDSVLSGFQYSDHKNNIIENSIDIFNNKKSMHSLLIIEKGTKRGPTRESNSGPLVPETRIIPLDQQATTVLSLFSLLNSTRLYFWF